MTRSLANEGAFSCHLTSALSGPREARPARRRRDNRLRACGAQAQCCHGPLQRIVRWQLGQFGDRRLPNNECRRLCHHTKRVSSHCLRANRKAKPMTANTAPPAVKDFLHPGEVVTSPLQVMVDVGSSRRTTPKIVKIVPRRANMKPMRRRERLWRVRVRMRLCSVAI